MARFAVALCLVLVLAGIGPAGAQEFGDRERGALVFRQCSVCHEVGEGAENGVGPHLNRLFGRGAGAVAGFDGYSEGLVRMGRDGLSWTFDSLARYIENPRTFASRTTMNFAGLKDPQDRADVLAFLRDHSDMPSNIPEAEPTAAAHTYTLDAEILSMPGDAAYGEYLAGECATCHQATGDHDGIPGIVGWPQEDFVLAMHSYRDKIRPHPVMQLIAGRFGDDEIAALAAYFATLEN